MHVTTAAPGGSAVNIWSDLKCAVGWKCEFKSCRSQVYLPDKILIFDHAEVPAGRLGNPFPRHQVSHHNGRRADANYNSKAETKRKEWGGGRNIKVEKR